MNYEALFSDETEDYRTPAEPAPHEQVTVRFRTARDDVKRVWMVTPGWELELYRYASYGCFDYYKGTFEAGEKTIYYWFRLTDGHESCQYNKLGVNRNNEDATLFKIYPGKVTPDWAKGAVMYQIFTDRFRDGDPANNVRSGEYRYLGREAEAVRDWYSYPQTLDVARFYGGDIQGIWDSLDYLQGLGVEVLYLNPIFVSPSNHKYDCQDYDAVDPHYGIIVKDGDYTTRTTDPANLEASNRFFASFMNELHHRGMRLIMDGVMNHCGSFHKWMNQEGIYRRQEGYPPGAFEASDSPYRGYFQFNNNQGWPYNDSYEGWWGHETLPKLNYEGSDELWQEMLDIGRKWVSPPYNVDGWRLDVAADLGHSIKTNHRFWNEFRQTVRKANPDAIVLAEHYDDPYPWIARGEWDTVMNYRAFMEPVSWYLTGMEKHSDHIRLDLLGNADEFWRTVEEGMPRLGDGAMIAMNQLSNHDHSRFLTRTNRTVGRLGGRTSEQAGEGVRYSAMYQAVVMQMTWPGAPTIYYGDEAGLCGWTDPDDRRTYPWGRENTGMIEFHREAIAVHREHPALRKGSLHKLLGEGAVVAYGRSLGSDIVITVVNASEEACVVRIPVWITGVNPDRDFHSLLKTSPVGYDQIEDEFSTSDGILTLQMVGESSIILEADIPGAI